MTKDPDSPSLVRTAKIENSSDEAETLIRLFERVAQQECWQPDDALRAFRYRSTYFGIWYCLGAHEQLIGGLQLVVPDQEGSFPSRTVWPELLCSSTSKIAHLAMLAVESSARGIREQGSIEKPAFVHTDSSPYGFWLLCTEMWRHCVVNDIHELFLEATPRTLRCYQRMGWPLEIRGDLRMHWGEPCYLTSMLVRDVGGELTKRAVRSPQYRSIVMHALFPPETKANGSSIPVD